MANSLSVNHKELVKSKTESLKEYARGITGGLLFSLPLFYTMEMWEASLSLPPQRLVAYLVVTFLLLMGYNKYAGLHPSAEWSEIITDSVEETGLGLLLSLAVLQSLGQLNWQEHDLAENLCKIIVQAMPVAIGISIGTAQLQAGSDEEKKSEKENEKSGKKRDDHSFAGRFILAICGTVVIAGNIAPTDEIPLIAVNSSVLSLVVIIIESLLLGATILLFSDFKSAVGKTGLRLYLKVLQHTMTTYLACLMASVLMLWFFGRFQDMGLSTAISAVIVLGLPAMLGASAGRLLIKNG